MTTAKPKARKAAVKAAVAAATPAPTPLDADYLLVFASYADEDCYLKRQRQFRSEQSLRWFIKAHRVELVEAGALVKVAGRWHVRLSKWADAFAACIQADSRRATEPFVPFSAPETATA